MRKKTIRGNFRKAVFTRDNYTCKCCGMEGADYHDLPTDKRPLDAHHITDRHLMPNGGYVVENGITVCGECHKKAEVWWSSIMTKFIVGYHPDDLYKLINSSYELAVQKSEKLNG